MPKVPIDSTDREEVICLIRSLFGDGKSKDRDSSILELARALGHDRTSIRIRQVLDSGLRTAVRRGILIGERRERRLQTRSIEAYDKMFLKEQFLASLRGRAWIERDLAIRNFSRWMGFRRTGKKMDGAVKSVINGLLREGRLESGGNSIRKG